MWVGEKKMGTNGKYGMNGFGQQGVRLILQLLSIQVRSVVHPIFYTLCLYCILRHRRRGLHVPPPPYGKTRMEVTHVLRCAAALLCLASNTPSVLYGHPSMAVQLRNLLVITTKYYHTRSHPLEARNGNTANRMKLYCCNLQYSNQLRCKNGRVG